MHLDTLGCCGLRLCCRAATGASPLPAEMKTNPLHVVPDSVLRAPLPCSSLQADEAKGAASRAAEAAADTARGAAGRAAGRTVEAAEGAKAAVRDSAEGARRGAADVAASVKEGAEGAADKAAQKAETGFFMWKVRGGTRAGRRWVGGWRAGLGWACLQSRRQVGRQGRLAGGWLQQLHASLRCVHPPQLPRRYPQAAPATGLAPCSAGGHQGCEGAVPPQEGGGKLAAKQRAGRAVPAAAGWCTPQRHRTALSLAAGQRRHARRDLSSSLPLQRRLLRPNPAP